MQTKDQPSDLDELKNTVTKHLRNELDIMEKALQLSDKDTREFHEWYMNHEYRKGIQEVVEIITGKKKTPTKYQQKTN